MSLLTTKVFDYVRKNPGCSSREIAEHFKCEVSDIVRLRSDAAECWATVRSTRDDYGYESSEINKHSTVVHTEHIIVPPATIILSERKKQLKEIVNKYLDLEEDKERSSLDYMYEDIYNLVDEWSPPQPSPHSLYAFVIFSFILFILSVYIDSEKMMISIIQYQDGIKNITTGTYQYFFHLQSDLVESCQELWRGQVFGNISIM
jgi:hypothetical protein